MKVTHSIRGRALRDTQRGDELTRVLMQASEDDEPLTPDEISRRGRAADEARKGQTIPFR